MNRVSELDRDKRLDRDHLVIEDLHDPRVDPWAIVGRYQVEPMHNVIDSY
jgi:hypothetical protein